MIRAQTFTPYYCPTEDRIRLVINYHDFSNRVDFWITRSFFLKLIPFWEEFLYKNGIQLLEQTSSADQKNNTSPTDNSTLTMTEKDPTLLESVDMKFLSENNQYEICFRNSTVQVISTLYSQDITQLLKSIFLAAPHIPWGISPALLEI